MKHTLFTHDYRSSMQRAAYAYLQRHEAQYLVDSDLLFDNCVHHLAMGLEVPMFMAQQLTHLAWTELQAAHRHAQAARLVAIETRRTPGAQVVHLIDTRTQQRYCVSARLLPQGLIAAGHSTPYHTSP
jgi:hypothetical protein